MLCSQRAARDRTLNNRFSSNKMWHKRQAMFRSAQALDLLRSGYATLEYDIVQERASALGRLGRRLEAALAAVAAYPRTANADRKIRDSLVEEAGYALWLFVVQREACGLNDSAQVIRNYGVPKEVCARMGCRQGDARPGAHRQPPTACAGAKSS